MTEKIVKILMIIIIILSTSLVSGCVEIGKAGGPPPVEYYEK